MTGIKLDLSEDNQLIASWDRKSPDNERAFQAMGGVWHDFNAVALPLNIDKIKAVHASFQGVKATKALSAWIKQAQATAKAVASVNNAAADAELPPLLMEEVPETAQALRPYQRAGVKFISEREGALIADQPGLGKSLQTISALIAAGVEGDILLLAPSSATQITWPAEVERWAPNDEVIPVIGSRKKREAALKCLKKKSKHKRRWILCNIEMAKVKYHKPRVVEGKSYKSWYEYVYPELFFVDYETKRTHPRLWSAIVIDESHRALITDKSQAWKQTQTRLGLGKLSTMDDGKRYALSGTPFRGKLQNLWGTLNWLFPYDYKSYWNWAEQWFDKETNFHTGYDQVGSIKKGMERDFHLAMAPFTLRRTKAEVAVDLPPKTYAGTYPPGTAEEDRHEGMIAHWVTMSPKQQKAYDQMKEEAMATLSNGTIIANGVLAELTRLKQFATAYGRIEYTYDADGYKLPVFRPDLPSAKFDWLVDFLDELGINGEPYEVSDDVRKVVIASQFTSVIDIFDEALNKLGIETCKVTGKVKAADRQAAAKAFQTNGGPRVMLLNTMAGGVSLTLDRADDIVILDETFIPDDQEQVEDRIHRVSRVHNVTVHYVRALGTVEERIANITFGRDSLQKQLLDGQRGVDVARKLIG